MKRLSFPFALLMLASLCWGQQFGDPTITNATVTTATSCQIAPPAPRSYSNMFVGTTIQNTGANWCYVWGGVSNAPGGGYWLSPTNGSVSIYVDGIHDNRPYWGTATGGSTTTTTTREPIKQ